MYSWRCQARSTVDGPRPVDDAQGVVIGMRRRTLSAALFPLRRCANAGLASARCTPTPITTLNAPYVLEEVSAALEARDLLG